MTKLRRTLGFIGLFLLLSLSFHNCISGSSADSSAGTGSNGGNVIPACTYSSNPAPVLQGIFTDSALTNSVSSISYRVGMGNDAGNEATRTLYLRANSGDNYSSVISVNCNGGTGIAANCDINNGNLRVRINPDQGAECLSGSTAIQINVSDLVNAPGCQNLAAQSNSLTLNVNLTNGCLPTIRLNPPNQYSFGQMGASVAIDGNWAVAATPGDELSGVDAGAAHVFQRNVNQWTNFQRIVPNSIAAGASLGAVAISGTTMVLGANLYANGTGRAWVYQFSGTSWVLAAELNAPTPIVGEKFGTSVAISNGVIAVGAPRNSAMGSQSGAVYLFSGSNFASVQTVYPYIDGNIAGDTLVQGEFGTSVSLNGTSLVVGAPFPNSSITRSEAVYLFRQNGNFAAAQKISNSDGGSTKRFGAAILQSGNSLIIGAPFYSSNMNSEVGRAYVYSRADTAANFSFTRQLNPGDPGVKDHFGQSVFLSGNYFYVGAPDKTFDQLAKVGAVYIFNSDGSQNFKVRSRRADRENDSFGVSIGVSNGWMISGAFNDESDVNYLDAGSVYMVDVP